MITPSTSTGFQVSTLKRITPIRLTVRKRTKNHFKKMVITSPEENKFPEELVHCRTIEEVLGVLDAYALPDTFHDFLMKCYNTMGGEKKKRRIEVFCSRAMKASKYLQTTQFEEKFKTIIDGAESSKELQYVLLALTYLFISNRNKRSHRKNPLLRKLYTRLEHVKRLIAEFDKDDSSYRSYITALRKAKIITETILKLRKQKIPNELSYYEPFHFRASQYREFNKALIKAYNPRKESDYFKFPVFKDVDKCLRKCAYVRQINISESEMRREVNKCLISLKKLISHRRKRDLYFIHSEHIEEKPYGPISNDSNEGEFMNRQEDFEI